MEPRVVYCMPKLDSVANIQRSGSLAVSSSDDGKQEQQKSIQEHQEQRPVPTRLQQQNRKAAPEAAPRRTLTSFAPSDVETMETPSINTRQPPDGHEFPDYQEESLSKTVMLDSFNKASGRSTSHYVSGHKNQPTTNVKNMIAMFSSNNVDDDVPDGEVHDNLMKKSLSKSVMNINTIQSSFNNPVVYNTSKRGSLDFTGKSILAETKPEMPPSNLSSGRLHKRSQSLIDMSDAKSGPTTDRWAQLLEQRRKGLSKLKGLVIPEHPDNEETVATIDLPEIKSATDALITDFKPFNQTNIQIPTNHARNSSTPSLNSIWNADTSNAIPKYSPAFKRKTMQVYETKTDTSVEPTVLKTALPKVSSIKQQAFQTTTSQDDDECRLPVTLSLNDAPKSLESITSPTRSDCSFEYISSSSPELKKQQSTDMKKSSMRTTTKEDMGKSEDESDNDSAVSSSQSSYISRNSPRASPNHLHSHYASVRSTCNNNLEHEPLDRSRNKYELTGSELQTAENFNRRLLKPQSVEAINRKNILASAKCRSGRDFNKGSPLIQRKFDETTNQPNNVTTTTTDEEKSQKMTEDNAQSVSEVIEGNHTGDKEIPKMQMNGYNKHIDENSTVSVINIRDEASNNRKEIKEVTKRTDVVIKQSITDKSLKRESLPSNINIKSTNKFVFSSRNSYSRTTSVTDLRKNFEKTTSNNSALSTKTTTNLRVSTNQGCAKKKSLAPTKRNSLPILLTTPTTTAHKTLSPSDVKNILDSSMKEWDGCFSKDDLKVISLYPEIPGCSIGITLAGGTDYETKDITIHKVRNGSAAYRDGRLHKGDKVLSINGKTMIGITHSESIAILKEPVAEIIIVACAGKEPTTPVLTSSSRNSSLLDLSANSSTTTINSTKDIPSSKRDDIAVKLMKDAASGLGFSMEGGKESPQGDVPLIIKKLFTGGIADKSGMLAAGDELLEINGVDVTCMPRIDAWTLMKKIPPGEVVLKVRR